MNGTLAGIFQNMKSVQLEKSKKVEMQYFHDKRGEPPREKGRIFERWVRFFRPMLNGKSDMIDPDILKRLLQRPVVRALGTEPRKEEVATAIKAMGKAIAEGPDDLPVELWELELTTRSDHPARASPTYHPHLVRGESPTALERQSHLYTPQKDGNVERGNYRGISLVSHTGKVILKVVARRLTLWPSKAYS